MTLKSTKTLKIALLLLGLIFLNSLIQIFINVSAERPIWITLFFIIPLPLLLVPITLIVLDLIKKDYVTKVGKLVEKSVYTIGISVEDSKVNRFKVNKQFVKAIEALKLDQEIEIQYYRRTKEMVQIRRISELDN